MAYNFTQESHSRSVLLPIVLLVISLLCMTIYAREGESGVLHSMQSSVSGVFMPVKVVSGVVSGAEDSAATSFGNVTADESTLSGLRAQNEELRETIAQLEEYRQQAARLQGMIGLMDTYSMTGTGAHVIARSGDAWNQMITLDKGTNDGVKAGMPVMGSSGLIGQVASVSGGSADVRLLADPQSGVSAMVQSSRVEGIVRGSLDGLLYLEDVNASSNVAVGDVIITSGLGGSFPSGIVIGTVVKVDQNASGVERKMVVTPNDSARALEEVLVVTGMEKTSTQTDTADTSSTSSSAASSTPSSSSTATSSSSNGQGV